MSDYRTADQNSIIEQLQKEIAELKQKEENHKNRVSFFSYELISIEVYEEDNNRLKYTFKNLNKGSVEITLAIWNKSNAPNIKVGAKFSSFLYPINDNK